MVRISGPKVESPNLPDFHIVASSPSALARKHPAGEGSAPRNQEHANAAMGTATLCIEYNPSFLRPPRVFWPERSEGQKTRGGRRKLP